MINHYKLTSCIHLSPSICIGDKIVASLSPVCCWSGYKRIQVNRDIGNYVAEIQSTSILDEQLVLVLDNVSGRHVSWCLLLIYAALVGHPWALIVKVSRNVQWLFFRLSVYKF